MSLRPAAAGAMVRSASLSVVLLLAGASVLSAGPNRFRLSRDLNDAIDSGRRGRIDVIVSGAAADVQAAAARHGARVKKVLDTGVVLDVDAESLDALSNDSALAYVSSDPIVRATMAVTDPSTGADQAAAGLVRGLRGSITGRGITVALIDSGVIRTDALRKQVVAAVDFTSARGQGVDEYGHGTHVAGIIGGDGFDSAGRRAGIAPGAHLVVLKTLDEHGAGRVSDIIAALDYIHANRQALNIRVVNMSVGSGVYESYLSDPLTLATRRIVEDGIVVVAAAGNAGKDPQGRTRYGGITAPGNAPWVLTVGASSHMGTIDRDDDTIGAFSSRGPTGYDLGAKPDLVAPGVGIESLSDPLSAFYSTRSGSLLDGTVATNYRPYLSLTGTSMASPVVAGTVALMLQANPSLTPNAVKAILQYTSQQYHGYDALTQGAGFLNAAGAVRLARVFATSDTPPFDDQTWTRKIIWANHRIRGGTLSPAANAWATDVTWGDARTPGGALIEWGANWGATCADSLCSSFDWGSPSSANVVWGPRCGGADCHEVWRRSTVGSQPLEYDGDTVVWGNDFDTVVWGNTDADTVVWGNSDSETVVWGNSDSETVVWGNSCVDSSCAPIVWGSTAN